MKKYLLFIGSTYYPSGGVEDFKGDFDSIEEAEKAAKNDKDWISGIHSWYQIVEYKTMKIVKENQTE